MSIAKSLAPGSMLNGGKYPITITGVLGADAQRITYRGTATLMTDEEEQQRVMEVVIREHFMAYCSERASDGKTVISAEDIAPTVEGYLNGFKDTSRLCFEIADTYSAIINVIDRFEENNTFYHVVEFLDGPTLEERVARNGPMAIEDACQLLAPISQALRRFHSNHSIHTDVHPCHIRFTNHNGIERPVLFGMYSLQHFDEQGCKIWDVPNNNCITGYAPPEQYRDIDHFIPQVDVYGLAATMVFAITGKHLPDSRTLTEEMVRDILPPTLPETYVTALLRALRYDYLERTSTMSGFSKDMNLSCDAEQRAPRHTATNLISDSDHNISVGEMHPLAACIAAIRKLFSKRGNAM